MYREEREKRTVVKLYEYNAETNRVEETDKVVYTGILARSMSMENFVEFFQEFLNIGGKQEREGREVGSQLRTAHRTLQRMAICFAMGIIEGISDQQYTDPRNETAIKTAQKITKMLKDGDLPLGIYL